MKAKWSCSTRVSEFDINWEKMPSDSGVYIIRGLRPIGRIGGTDKAGILYIGQTINLRMRIWSFLNCNHTASGFLWNHTEIARLVLDGDIRSSTDVEAIVRRLTIRYSVPISDRDSKERAVLFAYIHRFGEAPPLNLSIPSRWEGKPDAYDLQWAETGLLRDR